ncbi:MAG TPA: efflux RND transporter periplasmic adaptor subunit [Acetobacteraceae bacterium]|nr:efflux RND transporter periplasmic adaptor subunit [Acetobacteraceae bacterium]
MAAMIEVLGVVKRFGRFNAADRLRFSVDADAIRPLPGPNGAGTTTTIKLQDRHQPRFARPKRWEFVTGGTLAPNLALPNLLAMANPANTQGRPARRTSATAAGAGRCARPPAGRRFGNGTCAGNPPWAPALLGVALAIGLLAGSAPARAGNGTVVAEAKPFVTHFTAYGQVEPITILKLRAATTGVVDGLDVVPGAEVTAQTMLARLTGPTAAAELADRTAAVASAKAVFATARKAFGIQRQNLGLHLSTEQTVFQARAALLTARAGLDSAQSRLQAVRSELAVRSPKSGHVLTVAVADGERVEAGQTVLTIEPADDLWLKASFYGADAGAIRPGMQGRFRPAGGGPTIPIEVRSILGTLRPDGGLVAGSVAALPAPEWRSGESGAVVLDGQKGTLPAVPTRALILDQGSWWVMVHSSRGNERRAVVPGATQGDLTLIRHGLAAGSEVVVENPYLEFHKDFSRAYQQPD